MTPEGKVKRLGRAIYQKHGIYFFAVQQGGGSRAGIPDDLLIIKGRPVFVEYKAQMDFSKRTPTALKTLPRMSQVSQMEKIRANGGITLVTDIVTIQQLDIFLTDCTHRRLQNWEFTTLAWTWTVQDMLDYREGKGSLLFQFNHKYPCIPKFIPEED